MGSCPGRYLDGRSAQPETVTVTVDEAGLAIDATDGRRIDLWPWPALTAQNAPNAAETRLGCLGRDPASLVVSDNAGFAALVREQAPHVQRAGRQARGGIAIAGYLALALAVLVGIYFGIAEAAVMIVRLIPADVERNWGESYVRLFGNERGGACNEPAGRAALDRLTNRLQAAAEGMPAVSVHVFDASMVNAFALPGGQIALFSGLIEKAGTGDELAGVLAHEIGHVAERHPVRRLVEHVGLASAVGMVFGGTAWQEGDMMATLIGLSYSRSMEAEADRYAVELLRDAGIRRDGLARFFRRLQERGGDVPLALLSTHPPSGERADLIETGDGGPAMPEADWKAVKGICGVQE